MIYEHTIDDVESGEKALSISHWCGKNLKHDIDFIFDKGWTSVTVTFYINDEDDEVFAARWGR